VCDTFFVGPIILPLLDRLFTRMFSLSLSRTMTEATQRVRTERIHRMVANGWATLYQLSFFLQLLGTTTTPLFISSHHPHLHPLL
jgi:hypothetical protein